MWSLWWSLLLWCLCRFRWWCLWSLCFLFSFCCWSWCSSSHMCNTNFWLELCKSLFLELCIIVLSWGLLKSWASTDGRWRLLGSSNMLEQQVSVKKIASQRLLASHTGPTGAPYLLQASFLEWLQFPKSPDFCYINWDFFFYFSKAVHSVWKS